MSEPKIPARRWRLSCACGHHEVVIEASRNGLIVTDMVELGGKLVARGIAFASAKSLETLIGERPALEPHLREAWRYAQARRQEALDGAELGGVPWSAAAVALGALDLSPEAA